jgi:hypothetical protein
MPFLASNEYVFDLNAVLKNRLQCIHYNKESLSIPNIRDYAAYVLLACCDFCHDFDDQGGRVDDGIWGDGKDGQFVHLIRLALNNAISVSRPNAGNDEYKKFTKKWLIEAPRDRLSKPSPSISPSDVEDQTIRFFETHFHDKLKIDYTTVITYRTIITTIHKYKEIYPNINQAIYESGNEIYGGYERTCILDLDLDDNEDWDRDYSTEDKIHIALFLLNYFFPPELGNYNYNTQSLSYITFDADSNMPSKIFGLLDQVINLVTPLNISDSATGESHLVSKQNKRYSSKNCYKFPVNVGSSRYMYTGNLFTEDKGGFYIDKEGVEEYGEKNRYNFKVNFARCPPHSPSVSTIHFDSDHKSGPSVNYLANLANDNEYDYPGKKMANLSSFVTQLNGTFTGTDIHKKEIISQILFDIKRCGDWEQCNAAFFLEGEMTDRVILCSLDRLCSLYSRCIGNRTIWWHGTHMKLYRFIPKTMDDEKRASMKKAIEVHEEKILDNKISALGKSYKEITDRLEILILDINQISFTLPIKQKNNTVSYQICINITIIIIKYIHSKIGILSEKIKTVINDSTPKTSEYTTYKNKWIDEFIFKEMSELCGDNINEKNISIFDNNLSKFTTIIASSAGGLKLSKSSIFLYNGTDICDLYELLFEIEMFDAEKVRTQSILIKNYSESLINRKFFEFFKNIKHNLSFIANHEKEFVFKKIWEVNKLEYTETFEGGTRKLDNILYYNRLQTIIFGSVGESSELSAALNNIQHDGVIIPAYDGVIIPASGRELVGGSFISKNVGSGPGYNGKVLPANKSTKEGRYQRMKKVNPYNKSGPNFTNAKTPIDNILNSLESDLTDCFMVLSSELYRHKEAGDVGVQNIMEEFEQFCDTALLLFKNSYSILYESNNSIDVNWIAKWTALTKSYTYICLFFYIFRTFAYLNSTAIFESIRSMNMDTIDNTHDSQLNKFKTELLNSFFIEDFERFNIGDDSPTLLYQDVQDVTLRGIISVIVQTLNPILLVNAIITYEQISEYIFGVFFGIESLFRLVIYKWSITNKGVKFTTNPNFYGYTEIGDTHVLSEVLDNSRLFKRGLGRLGSENEANRTIFLKIGSQLHNIMLLGLDRGRFENHMNEIFKISLPIRRGGSKKIRGSIKLRKVNIQSKKVKNRKIRVTKIHRNNSHNKTTKNQKK